MRKITIGIRQSLDGVVQAPSGSEEDSGGGFDLGGWGWAFSDAIANEFMDDYLYRNATFAHSRDHSCCNSLDLPTFNSNGSKSYYDLRDALAYKQ